MNGASDLADEMGAFVSGLDADSMPAGIIERARVLLLNGYAMGVGAQRLPVVAVAQAAALRQESLATGGATVLGQTVRVPLTAAMQANATLLHARVQDDTIGSSHFAVVLIPLLTALAETRRHSLHNFLPALVAGYEVGGALESRLSSRSTSAGFRGTLLFGTVAGAAAAARFMELPAGQVAAAIAMATAFTGGTLQSFADETDEWRLQPGIAATVGYLAATFAASGAKASPNAFAGRNGFSRAFAGDPGLLAGAHHLLGREWAVERVAFKPFPVAMFNQAVVHAAQALRERSPGAFPHRIVAALHPFEANYPGIAASGPFQGMAGALMSAPVCVALTLVDGAPTLRNLESSGRDVVAGLAATVTVVADPALDRLSCRMTADWADDRHEEVTASCAPGKATFDMREAERVLRSICGEQALPARTAELIKGFVVNLPDSDIADIPTAFALR
jgi:2-methylcitrate dehydratase PrpD